MFDKRDDFMRVMRNMYFLIFSLVLLASSNLTDEQTWVNNTYAQMSDDERIGQLFMIRAHSDLGLDHINSVKTQIKKSLSMISVAEHSMYRFWISQMEYSKYLRQTEILT